MGREGGVVDLTKEELRDLDEAMRPGLPTYEHFERFARLHLGINLADVSGSKKLPDVVLDLFQWANSSGSWALLLGEAPHFSSHPGLHDICRAILTRMGLAPARSGSRTAGLSGRPLQHRDWRAINFQGREQEREKLTVEVRSAAGDGTSLSFVGIKGMGGVGKTALAAELAERLAGEFPGGVLWANLQEETPAEAARRWLRELKHYERDLGPDDCLRQFRQLAGEIRPLNVLDNVPRPEKGVNLAEPLLVKAPRVATLLTTRFSEAVPAGVRVEELDVLPPDDARALLRSHVGSAADADPAAADVVDLCERLPLFLKVAGAAVAKGYYSLAGYAQELRKWGLPRLLADYCKELRRRGLVALADEIERASVVFELSWTHLSAGAKEAFAVLALAPGEDVGANLVRAWQRPTRSWTEGWRCWLDPRRWWAAMGRPEWGAAKDLLDELANASLLTPVADRADRYRYHDRVRDYALTKLPLPEDEARRRLLTCWTDWDMVKAEFEAVGADGLATQYLRLRSWRVEEPAVFGPWFHFARGQASVLKLYPELFFQQAFNEAADSPVSQAALERLGKAEEPGRWLGWENRPREWVPPACLMVLRGHSSLVFSVAVTGDGRIAVSGSDDMTVRVWDLAEGRCSAVLEGHTSWVRSVAVAADGRTAVSGSSDRTVRVWDLAGDHSTAVVLGHTDFVSGVAVSGDGQTAVSGSYDKTIRVWDLSVGRCTTVLESHTDKVYSVAVTGDGGTAVSGSDDGTVRVWDLVGGRCTAVLEGHTSWVTSVAVSADGRTAVSRSEDETVRVWDLAGGRCSATHAAGSDEAQRAWATANNGRVSTVTREPYGLTLRDTTSGTILAHFPGSFSCSACSADGRHVVAGDGRGGVFLLRLHSRRS
jgi:WD40 repeat protein